MFSNLQTKKVLFFWQNTIWDMKGWLHVPFPSLLTLSSSSIKQVYIQDSARSSVSAASSWGCCCIAGSIAVSGIHNQCVVTVLNSADVTTFVRPRCSGRKNGKRLGGGISASVLSFDHPCLDPSVQVTTASHPSIFQSVLGLPIKKKCFGRLYCFINIVVYISCCIGHKKCVALAYWVHYIAS